MQKSTVRAGSNIAFIKYWGIRDSEAGRNLNLPLSNSISMTLADAHTTTTVVWDETGAQQKDVITLDGRLLDDAAAARLMRHLDLIRQRAGVQARATVVSRNNFPMASGIASSASGFAALTVAGCAALGLELSAGELSALARRGSGSASRSLFGGFVEWEMGTDDASSVAREIAPADHWALRDVVAIVSAGEKETSSAHGHTLAASSPFNAARIAWTDWALAEVRRAIATRDIVRLGRVIEQDALAMHGVMMTGDPSLLYWQPGTLEVMHAVRRWRKQGLPVYFTIDAGPNVHLICEASAEPEVVALLGQLPSVASLLASGPGGAPVLLDEHLF